MMAFTSGFFLLITLFAFSAVQGKNCPGYCTSNLANCKAKSGKVIGYCTNEKACCDLIAGMTGSCGSYLKKNMTTAYFKSPNFPGKSSGDLNCEFKVDLISDQIIGIRIEFLEFEMDGMSYGHGRQCDSDMLFIKGFGNWAPPARCGQLTGYSTFIDRRDAQVKDMKTLTLLTLMSSPSYSWHIKITQISKLRIESSGSNPGKESRSVEQDRQNEDHYTSDAYGPLLSLQKPLLNDFETSDEAVVETGSTTGLVFSETISAELDHNVIDAATPLIVNGEDTVIDKVPWQASLRVIYDPKKYQIESIKKVIGENCSISEGAHFCGGSIISDQFILTAAHCFFGTSKTRGMQDLSIVKVILGDTNRCQDNITDTTDTDRLNATEYEIETVTFHYGYDNHLFDSDIALVKLKTKIRFNSNVKVIPLADEGEDFTGERALVSGWGLESIDESSASSNLPEILQSSNEFVVQNQSYCRSMLHGSFEVPTEDMSHMKYSHIYAGVFCTGSQNSSILEVFTGQGDSGGPLVILRNGTQQIQAGIVSYALSSRLAAANKTDNLDFFQSVTFFRPWIDLARTIVA